MKLPSLVPFAILLGSLVPVEAAATRARQEGATLVLPPAREVIDRHATVCHLRESLEKAQSLHAKGKVSLPAMGIEGTVELWRAKPARQRSSMEIAAIGTVLGGYDGEVGWTVQPMMGARLLQGIELLQAKLEAAWDERLKPEAAYESLRTVGRESFEGKECWKVEVVARALPGMDAEATREARTTHEFYELEGGLLAGVKGRAEGDLGAVPYTYIYSGYKDFGGQQMAAKTLMRQAGQEVVLTMDSVEFDTVSDEQVRPPPEIQKMLAPKPAPVTPQ